MTFEIDRFRPHIAELCRRYCVRRLEAFGSVTRSDFDSATSDVDLIVEFADAGPDGAADRYFDLHDALQAVLGRRVDLIVRGALQNPYFLEAVDRERLSLYVP